MHRSFNEEHSSALFPVPAVSLADLGVLPYSALVNNADQSDGAMSDIPSRVIDDDYPSEGASDLTPANVRWLLAMPSADRTGSLGPGAWSEAETAPFWLRDGYGGLPAASLGDIIRTIDPRPNPDSWSDRATPATGGPAPAAHIDPRVIADVFGPRRSVLGDPGFVLWGKAPPYTGYGRNSRAELSNAPEAPSQEYNNRVTESLLSFGANPRFAEWIGPKLGSALQMFSPVGVVTSAEDASYHADRGEYPAMVAAALGLIPVAGRPIGTIAGKTMRAVAQDGNHLTGGAWLSRHPPGQVAAMEEVRRFHAARQNVDEAGASLYPFETAPQRPYKWDYPDDALASKSGPPLVTMDNDKVVAKRLVGRQEIGGPDVPMSAQRCTSPRTI